MGGSWRIGVSSPSSQMTPRVKSKPMKSVGPMELLRFLLAYQLMRVVRTGVAGDFPWNPGFPPQIMGYNP